MATTPGTWFSTVPGTAINWATAVVGGIAQANIYEDVVSEFDPIPSRQLFAPAGAPVSAAQVAAAQAISSSGNPPVPRVAAVQPGQPSQTTVSRSVSGAVSVDAGVASVHVLTLTGNVSALTVANVSATRDLELHLVQDATGGRTIAGLAAGLFHFAGGAAPTWTTAAGKRDIVRFRQVGGAFYELSRALAVA